MTNGIENVRLVEKKMAQITSTTSSLLVEGEGIIMMELGVHKRLEHTTNNSTTGGKWAETVIQASKTENILSDVSVLLVEHTMSEKYLQSRARPPLGFTSSAAAFEDAACRRRTMAIVSIVYFDPRLCKES